MSNVVSFAGALNARRVAAETAQQEARRAARAQEEWRAISESLGGTAGAELIASVVTELKAKDQADRYLPAYCDPANEVRGVKYEATRGLRPAEIAARIRADIREAQKAGRLPKDAKVGVRTHTYSGGYSIDVRVTELPQGFRYYSEKAAAWRKQFPGMEHRCPMAWCEEQSEEHRSLLKALEAIRSAYNRDNSDSMTDYFDVRYYGSAGIDWRTAEAAARRDVEAAPDDLWADLPSWM